MRRKSFNLTFRAAHESWLNRKPNEHKRTQKRLFKWILIHVSWIMSFEPNLKSNQLFLFSITTTDIELSVVRFTQN